VRSISYAQNLRAQTGRSLSSESRDVPPNRHDGHQHCGDELVVGAAHNEHLARTDDDRTAGPHHASAGGEAVALGRGEEVDLVLDRQYFGAGRRIIAAQSTVPGFGLHA
jgi:hypothetical protein